MGLSKKRKSYFAQIPLPVTESKKHQKIDQENQRKRRFLRKQEGEEEFWD